MLGWRTRRPRGHVWAIFEHVWDLVGTCLERVSDMLGTRLEQAWDTFRIGRVALWADYIAEIED